MSTWGNYITKTDLTNAGVALGSHSDAEVLEMIQRAEALVEQHTKKVFYAATATKYFDGNGQRVLLFIQRTTSPLISITGNTVYIIDPTMSDEVIDSAVLNTDFFLSPEGDYLELCSESEVDPRSPLSRGTWPRGTRNIKITGSWGIASVPPGIKRAAVLLVAHEVDPNYAGLLTAQETEWSGDVRTRHVTTAERKAVLTGIPAVDLYLRGHVAHHASIGVL